ncbi:META domain-containing protein [Campylobacter cuniculorum]|nr:putative heat shock protein HslJ [Campylobacter cuniculorum DSM 23162 = LMG 24588]
MKTLYLLPLMFFLYFFTACSSNADEANGQENLILKENQILNIEKISINGKIYDAKSAESKPNINFGADKFYGYSGCNRFFGSYQKNSKSMSIEDQSVASTQMLCHPLEVMEFEHLFLTNLQGNFKISYENDKLILDNGTMKIFFE